MLLAEYPHWVGDFAVQGWIREKKWLPKISQLRKRLEAEIRIPRETVARKQEAVERARRLAGPPPPPKPTIEELHAKHGDNWGLAGEPRRPRPPDVGGVRLTQPLAGYASRVLAECEARKAAREAQAAQSAQTEQQGEQPADEQYP